MTADLFAPLALADAAAERVLAGVHDDARRLLARARGVCLRWPEARDGEQAEALYLVRALDLEVWPTAALRQLASATITGAEPTDSFEVRRELSIMRAMTATLADASSPTLAAAVASWPDREEILRAAIESARAARCADAATVTQLAALARQVRAVIAGEPVEAANEEIRHAA